MQPIPQADDFEKLGRVPGGWRPVARSELDREADVLLGGQRGDEVEELEDEADLLAAEEREFPLSRLRDVVAVDDDAAARGRVDSAEHVEQRRLARTARAEDDHELASRDHKICVVQRMYLDLAHPVRLHDVLEHDERVGSDLDFGHR